VFLIEALTCPHGMGPRRLFAALFDPEVGQGGGRSDRDHVVVEKARPAFAEFWPTRSPQKRKTVTDAPGAAAVATVSRARRRLIRTAQHAVRRATMSARSEGMKPAQFLCTPALLIAMNACTPHPPNAPINAPLSAGGRPRTPERVDERLAMVAKQIEARGVGDPRVLDALRAVPRHWFVPANVAGQAYLDGPLPIAGGQTISQPYIVALMTATLELQPDQRVLEIGTGSGYQAAILSELTAQVFTIEIVPELARTAREVFDRYGYADIRSLQGDGYAGWPEHAPFDAIIVTAAPDHIPPALIEQLKVGGRMVLPKGRAGYQSLILLTKGEDGRLSQRGLAPVRFVPMTGEAQHRKR